MPRQILPSRADFQRISKELKKLGFREISSKKVREQIVWLGLKAPRRRLGRETGFVYHNNGLWVYVWTTWLLREGRARREDTGWVLISTINKALYFSRPTHRTKNFVVHLLSRAWIAKWRIDHRPSCPECGKWMNIARGRGTGARYWSCKRVADHEDGKAVHQPWDKNLPPKAKKYVRRLRKEKSRSRERRREEGRPVGVAPLRRRSWRGSPEGSA